jgi:hypothetical protein
MSFYQLGNKALKVSMQLFALNRTNLLNRIRADTHLEKSSIVVLQGGESNTRYCSDHEPLFRQVILPIYICEKNIGVVLKNTFFLKGILLSLVLRRNRTRLLWCN